MAVAGAALRGAHGCIDIDAVVNSQRQRGRLNRPGRLAESSSRVPHLNRVDWFRFKVSEFTGPRSPEGVSLSLSLCVSMTLADAARDGDLEALRDRIARGDDVDGRDHMGWTPLMKACYLGHHECAQALIEAGAAVDKVDNGLGTALMQACRFGHYECT